MRTAGKPDLPSGGPFTLRVSIPMAIHRKKPSKRQTHNAEIHHAHRLDREGASAHLVEGIARAFYWQRLLDTGQVASGSEIARLEKLHPSTVNELLRMTLLDPQHVLDILKGKQPARLSMLWLTRNKLPGLWSDQLSAEN